MPVILPKPPPYMLNIYIRLRAPRLLRPSYKSPYAIGADEASLCFRHLELCPCFHLVKPSSRCRVAVAALSSRSRAPRLLRPSSKSFRYRMGPRRGALTSSLGKALTSSLWLEALGKKLYSL